jgi:hypothetical protein
MEYATVFALFVLLFIDGSEARGANNHYNYILCSIPGYAENMSGIIPRNKYYFDPYWLRRHMYVFARSPPTTFHAFVDTFANFYKPLSYCKH